MLAGCGEVTYGRRPEQEAPSLNLVRSQLLLGPAVGGEDPAEGDSQL